MPGPIARNYHRSCSETRIDLSRIGGKNSRRIKLYHCIEFFVVLMLQFFSDDNPVQPFRHEEHQDEQQTQVDGIQAN